MASRIIGDKEERDILCPQGCILGVISFSENTDETTWQKAMQGYQCPIHPPQEDAGGGGFLANLFSPPQS